MTPTLRACLFVALALIQLGVPLSMITQRQLTLRHGTAYKFRTAPVDPYDAFRGRYVHLRFDADNVPAASATPGFSHRQPAYATLDVDSNGFARIAHLRPDRPDSGDFIRVTTRYPGAAHVPIEFPFTRFYLNEHDAPAAERAYWQNSTRTNWNTYALVRVRGGSAVIEHLIVDDLPIREFLLREDASP